jgi:hypothetical protein
MRGGASASSFMNTDMSPSRMNGGPTSVGEIAMQFAQLAKQGGIEDNE